MCAGLRIIVLILEIIYEVITIIFWAKQEEPSPGMHFVMIGLLLGMVIVALKALHDEMTEETGDEVGARSAHRSQDPCRNHVGYSSAV